MTLLSLFLLLIVTGVIMWGVNAFIPMAGPIKGLLNTLVWFLMVIYILQFFGVIKVILPYPNGFGSIMATRSAVTAPRNQTASIVQAKKIEQEHSVTK
jgi:hypothetical protein